MRIVDVILIENSGITNEQYTYCLKAHFDNIICQNNKVEFAVEYDCHCLLPAYLIILPSITSSARPPIQVMQNSLLNSYVI